MTDRTPLLHGTHHVAVICSDYVRSKHFYVEVLGLELVAEVYREARRSHKLDLKLPDGTQIELFSFPDPPPRPSYPEACGLRHLAFAVADLDVTVSHLEEHGIKVEPVRVDEYTGQRFTFFADPDGLPLELYERIGSPYSGR
ncbi:MAG: VOC family protein [Fimbriiglobus sp.]|jgi:glyoxylase I family protein|nr:VOC family protein [Fimbriiglobus sp.]